MVMVLESLPRKSALRTVIATHINRRNRMLCPGMNYKVRWRYEFRGLGGSTRETH
jgi:hypothetical protein